MGEDDIVELLWNSGQVVRSSRSQRPPSVPPPCILRGSGSGNDPLPKPPPLQASDQNLFICEDEMASWLDHHPLREDEFRSHLFYSGVVTIPFTQKQDSVFLPPPPSASDMDTPTAAETLMDQVMAARRAENFINSRLRGNIYTGCRVEAAAPWVPVVGDSTQVGSNATQSSSANDSCLTPPTVTGAVSQTFAVPSLSRKAIETVCKITRPSSSRVSKAETEPIQIQTETEAEAADERKRKEREQPADDTKETAKEARGSTSRKRKRAAAMHNLSERRRREKINEKMKALQELVPRCNKTDKASMLDDAIEYLKFLQMQIQIMSMGGGSMMPMMYTPNMQRFMPNTTMGMMGVNRPPFIPFPNIQAFDHPSKVHLPSQQPYPVSNQPQFPGYLNTYSQQSDPVSNQPQFPGCLNPYSQQPDPVSNQPRFPGYLNPYGQFVGLQQMQQPPPPPPPLQNQTTSQLSFSQTSSSKEPEDQDNKQTG